MARQDARPDAQRKSTINDNSVTPAPRQLPGDGNSRTTTNPRRERMVRFAAAIALATTLLLASANGEELLLDFATPYCGPCRQMEPVIQSFENAGYPIRKVDATREPQLSDQFNVTRFPTFLMLVDGREVDRVVGYTSGERIQQMFATARQASVQRTRGQSPDPSPPAAPRRETPNSALGPTSPLDDPTWPKREGWTSGDRDGRTNSGAEPQPLPTDTAAALLSATVRLRVDDAQGRSFGTGTIIDARSGEALVVTCGHLFRDSKGKGPVSVELFEATATGIRVADQLSGQVISYDLDRDLALVSIRPKRPVSVAKVAPPQTTIDRGDRVVTVGCSNGDDPTALPSRVTELNRYQGPPNIEASGAPVEGRSGGGLFNVDGQLIGVCFAADYEGNEGLYSALESIHGELDRLNLSDVYSSGTGDQLAAASPSQAAADRERVVRLQDELPSTAHSDLAEIDRQADAELRPGGALPAPQGLSQVEQAAFEEIMTRATTHEVVCIVRPNDPGGQSEIITLNGVSPEFIRALSQQQRMAQAPANTR
jgi:thiol-disulfide isomerase/thioredoxin